MTQILTLGAMAIGVAWNVLAIRHNKEGRPDPTYLMLGGIWNALGIALWFTEVVVRELRP